jgi:hemerythrin-like metal-binding protein
MHQAILSSDISSGVLAMDALHKNFFDALEELSSSIDSEFHVGYDKFLRTVERAFATEEKWMEEIDFPALKSHREQHARVLGGLHNIRSRVVEGDLALGHDAVERLLPQWFIFHTFTMDAPLATAMQMFGGQGNDAEISSPALQKTTERVLEHA